MRRPGEALRLTCVTKTVTFTPPFLPPSLGENNDGTSAAFEGGLNCSCSQGLRGVSGHVGVPPQLLEQLSVEGGRLSLSRYLSPREPFGKDGGGYSQSRITATEAFTPLRGARKHPSRLLVSVSCKLHVLVNLEGGKKPKQWRFFFLLPTSTNQ